MVEKRILLELAHPMEDESGVVVGGDGFASLALAIVSTIQAVHVDRFPHSAMKRQLRRSATSVGNVYFYEP